MESPFPADHTPGPQHLSRLEHEKREKDTKMKKLGLATMVAGGMAAAILGLASPAQATVVAEPVDVLTSSNYPDGVDHRTWLDQMGPHVVVPQVDKNVHQSR
jgi:hypothetical protein